MSPAAQPLYKNLYSCHETATMGWALEPGSASLPARGTALGRQPAPASAVGEELVDWRPMKDIGAGVCEIRIHGAVEHRVLYVARYPEAVYVLHAFEKKTRKTPRLNLAVARARWRNLSALRESRRL